MWCECYHDQAMFNTLRPRQDGHNFADDIFTCIFFNENCCILIKFSLKYVRKGPIDNNPALVQIMAWCRSGDKPLSEPMMISLPMHICVTRPQWVNMRLYDTNKQWQPMWTIHMLYGLAPGWYIIRFHVITQNLTGTHYKKDKRWRQSREVLLDLLYYQYTLMSLYL